MISRVFHAGSLAAQALIVSAALAAAGCASRDSGSSEVNVDPLEKINRPIYAFNDVTDRYLLRPVGQGYNFILPRFVRTGIGNFYDNIVSPRNIINAFLQGELEQGFSDTGRFALNSTMGLLGLVDIASKAGLKPHIEDFGQTLAVWGVPSGPYIVVPFLGPRTVRSGVGTIADLRLNPIIFWDNSSARTKLFILGIVDARASFIGPDEAIQDAFDPYLLVRDFYLQNREYQINKKGTRRQREKRRKEESDSIGADPDFDDDFDDGLEDF